MDVLKRGFYFYKRNFYTITIPATLFSILGVDYFEGKKYRAEKEEKRRLKKLRESGAVQIS